MSRKKTGSDNLLKEIGAAIENDVKWSAIVIKVVFPLVSSVCASVAKVVIEAVINNGG